MYIICQDTFSNEITKLSKIQKNEKRALGQEVQRCDIFSRPKKYIASLEASKQIGGGLFEFYSISLSIVNTCN